MNLPFVLILLINYPPRAMAIAVAVPVCSFSFTASVKFVAVDVNVETSPVSDAISFVSTLHSSNVSVVLTFSNCHS